MKVSVIVPCRNEEKYIEDCILSLINNDYPNELTEIIVVDGLSTDNTVKIVNKISENHHNIKILTNKNKTAPYAFNIGIEAATGNYILIIGAHSFYPKDYISGLMEWHKKIEAYNIGGVLITDVKTKNKKTESIIAVLSNKFGVGNASFRLGTSEIKSVDTVAYGCYKKEAFEKFGLFNTKLTRNQDIEFNKRIINAKEKIFLVPEVTCKYFARESYSGIAKNNFQNGFWNILTVYYTKDIKSLSLRHFIPLFFVLSIIIPPILSIFWIWFILIAGFSIIAYLLLIIAISLKLNNKKTSFINLFKAFIVLHLSYGFGSLFGIIKLPYLLISKNKS